MDDQPPIKFQETDDGEIALWNPFEERGNFAIHTSLPSRTKEERTALIALKNSDFVGSSKLINTEFEIYDYIAHPVAITDKKTGEVKSCVRIVFPQQNGPPLAFVSVYVLESMKELSYVTGRYPPWNPPIRVRLLRLPGTPPNFLLKLEYVSG